MKVNFVEKETAMTIDKNNFEKSDVAFTSCFGCFQKNL